MRDRLEHAAGQRLSACQLARLAVLAALHDLGKLSWGFQNKAHTGEGRQTCGHIMSLPGLMADRVFAVTEACFAPLAEWFQDDDELGAYISASFSHHGMPVNPFDSDSKAVDAAHWWDPQGELRPLEGLQELLRACRVWFPQAFERGRPPLPRSAGLSHLFAGLVSLADWLGSDERLFPFCGREGRPSSGDPMPFARQAAQEALSKTKFLPQAQSRLNGEPPDFERQFRLPSPRPLQRAIQQIPLRPDQGLVILEAETGSGKTEAAWLHFMRLFCAGLVDGLYFANPLRLAATQIHDRLSRYARNSFGELSPGVVLAVPGYLKVDQVEGYRLPGYRVLWDEDQEHKADPRYWAAENPKRFLCAGLAAGTIDQALMACLRIKHAPMRAAALSRSLLVVDEVHASDQYMTQLTMRLVQLFSRAGGQALLMSATLGGETRERFLACMQKGKAPAEPELSHAQARDTVYPLISLAGSGPVPIEAEEGPNGVSQKSVAIHLVPLITQPDKAAILAAQAAQAGAAVLVLRNTVRQAVATARELERQLRDQPGLLFRPAGVSSAHHSRYAGPDRERLDHELIRLYGKDAASRGESRAGVVAATQTVEQSLDLDFDLLITDLCPMDVLLQRIGRLHRHRENRRPPGYEQPLCRVLTPEADLDWLLGRQAKSFGIGPDLAYEDPRILAATWRILDELAGNERPMRIPAMNRGLVEDSLHSQVLEALELELGPRWAQEGDRVKGSGLTKSQLARMHSIEWDQVYGPGSAGMSERVTPQTRLGLGDRNIELDQPFSSPFGAELRELKIPGWMVQGAPLELACRTMDNRQGRSLRFTLRGPEFKEEFIYNRFGLEKWGIWMKTNLLTDAMLTVREPGGRERALSLPGVLAAMQKDEVAAFSHLQPHQAHPWHAFLCQLAAMCLLGSDLPEPQGLEPHRLLGEHNEDEWREMLRGLAPGFSDDEPWRLAVDDLGMPAFMQPPAPEDDWKVFKESTVFPDELDVLVPSKCHGLKFPLQNAPGEEDWVYALISLQTHGSYMGRGNYGIARQNGGYATRPGVSLCAGISPGARWARDARVICQNYRPHYFEDHAGLFSAGGIRLLWLEPWAGCKDESLALDKLHPLFIEVCRRIRLEPWLDETFRARRASSQAQRVDAKQFNGALGDPWIPIKLTDKQPSAFNARPGYRNLQEVVFGGDRSANKYEYRQAMLQLPQEWERGCELWLTVRVLVRGEGKTEGYEERVIPVPGPMGGFLKRERGTAAKVAQDMVSQASALEYKALKPALVCALQVKQKERTQPNYEQKETTGWADEKARALDLEVDRHFFEYVWRCLERKGKQEDHYEPWKSFLRAKGKEHFERAMQELPLPQALKYKAWAEAEGLFNASLNKHLKLIRGEADV